MSNEGLVKEELERVFDLYSAQLRAFRRSLWVVIVSGLAVFVLIVLPFLNFRGEHAELLDLQARLSEDHLQATETVERTRADLALLGERDREFLRLADRLIDYDHYAALFAKGRERREFMTAKRAEYAGHEFLGEWSAGRAKTLPDDAIQRVRYLTMGVGHDCEWWLGSGERDVHDYVACRALADFSDHHDRVARDIAPALERVPGDASGLDDLDAIVARVRTWMYDGQPHWARNRPWDGNAQSLRGFLTADLRAYGDELARLRGEIRAGLAPAEVALADLERAQARTQARLVEIEALLDRIAGFNSIGTPVGDLPINLGQIVLLFPAILGLSYLVIANSFSQAARLRHALERLFALRDADGAVMDRDHLATVAPLWLDRRDGGGTWLAHWAVLATPLCLICLNLLVIHDTQALSANFSGDAVVAPAVYLAIYAGSLILAALALISMRQAARTAKDA